MNEQIKQADISALTDADGKVITIYRRGDLGDSKEFQGETYVFHSRTEKDGTSCNVYRVA
jgi:hypothetical protein